MKNIWWLLLLGGALFLFGGGMVSSRTRRLAFAIAVAERGWDEVLSGNIARNNPGDIKDLSGQIATYPTLADGWNTLYHQVDLMFTGQSKWYKPDMTLMEVGKIYVGTPDYTNWVLNVATVLGVSPDIPLEQIV